MEGPVVPLQRKLYGHPLSGLLWERQFEKVLLEHGWEKVPNWECLFVNRAKKTLLIRVRGRYKTGWEETEHQSDLESSDERRCVERTNIIS